MRSSAVRRSARIFWLLSWVSLGIGANERVTLEGLEKDARHSHILSTFAFLPYHCSVSFLIKSPLLLVWLSCNCVFCHTSMALDSSGLSNTALLNARHLTSDLLHSPNTSHGQFFNRSNLLVDRTHDMYMTPDASPVVRTSMTICALKPPVLIYTEYTVLPSGASAYSRIG
jgi:hypothetical protein